MKAHRFVTLAALALSTLGLSAQDRGVQRLIAEYKRDIAASVRTLNTTRERISKERQALLAELETVTTDWKNARSVLIANRRAEELTGQDPQSVAAKLASVREQRAFLNKAIEEFALDIDSAMHPVERSARANWMKPLLYPGQLDLPEKFERLNAFVERALELAGGASLEGQVAGPDGAMQKGRTAIFGPVAFFAGSGEAGTGIALRGQGIESQLQPLATPAIPNVVQGAPDDVPFDFTGEARWKLETTDDNLWQQIRKGGFWMIPILALGVFAVLIIVWKWLQLMKLREPAIADIEQIAETVFHGDSSKALAQCQSIAHPIGRVIAEAIPHIGEPREAVEEIIFEAWTESQPILQRGIPFLATIAAAAPLLGLLGTVTGMISTFRLIEAFTNTDTGNFSSGIAEALVTTKWGLIVAIPALIAHALLNRRAQSILSRTEKLATAFANRLYRG